MHFKLPLMLFAASPPHPTPSHSQHSYNFKAQKTHKKPGLFQLINPCGSVVVQYPASSGKQSQPAQILKANSFLLLMQFQKGGTETRNETPQCGSQARLVKLIKYEKNPAEFSCPLNTFQVLVYRRYAVIKQVYLSCYVTLEVIHFKLLGEKQCPPCSGWRLDL